MSHTLRAYRESDWDAYWAAIPMVYGDGSPVAEPKLSPRRHYVSADDDGSIGAFYDLVEAVTYRGAATVPTNGVAMVGVLPKFRGTGRGVEMMRWSLGEMRERGVCLAALYAFGESYYRQFGYEAAGGRTHIACPVARMPRLKSELPVRALQGADRSAVRSCYEAFARARSGCFVRDDARWERFLGPDTAAPGSEPLTVYAVGEPIEGYAALRQSPSFHTELEISELVWTSRRGYEALLALLRAFGVNKATLKWCEPLDGPFLTTYAPSVQYVESRQARLVMFRAIDVPAALARLQPEGEGEFSLAVRDPELPKNDGPWRVAFRGGRTSVEPGGKPDLTLGIGAFSQAFMGQPSLADLLRSGFASMDEGPAKRAALAALAPASVYCLDFY